MNFKVDKQKKIKREYKNNKIKYHLNNKINI